MFKPANRIQRTVLLLWATLIVAADSAEGQAITAVTRDAPTFSKLSGRIALDNERVLVKVYDLPAGQSTGSHTHAAAELLVFVKGGTLQSEQDGRKTLWRDGRVMWLDAAPEPDMGQRNTGNSPVEFVEVILKPRLAGKSPGRDYGYLSYPKVIGEDILENERVIVQRFAMHPGEWEGVHGHHPNTLYIFIKGGRWLSKTTNPPAVQRGNSPDGDIAWMAPIDVSSGHQSGNVGSTTSDVVWIALKE